MDLNLIRDNLFKDKMEELLAAIKYSKDGETEYQEGSSDPDPDNILNILSEGTFVEKIDDIIEEVKKTSSGGSGGTSKIQKYTINAEEYYDKTSKSIVNFEEREVTNGIFDVDVAVRVVLVDDAFGNPAPVFANQPISYESDEFSPFVYADLKEIVLYLEEEGENEDTGEMELFEVWINASILVRIFDDNLNVPIKFEINNGTLYAEILARYEGLDNDVAADLREGLDVYTELLKSATLYYVPYEEGDETIAEVSI